MIFIAALVLIALVMLPLIVAYRNAMTGRKLGNAKKALMLNLAGFAVICLIGIVLPLGGFVSAATTTAAAATSVGAGLGYLGVALSTGLACIGAGIAVGNASAAAIGAVSEDPKMFARAMIFVIIGEGVAIYGIAISILIYIKIH